MKRSEKDKYRTFITDDFELYALGISAIIYLAGDPCGRWSLWDSIIGILLFLMTLALPRPQPLFRQIAYYGILAIALIAIFGVLQPLAVNNVSFFQKNWENFDSLEKCRQYGGILFSEIVYFAFWLVLTILLKLIDRRSHTIN